MRRPAWSWAGAGPGRAAGAALQKDQARGEQTDQGEQREQQAHQGVELCPGATTLAP